MLTIRKDNNCNGNRIAPVVPRKTRVENIIQTHELIEASHDN